MDQLVRTNAGRKNVCLQVDTLVLCGIVPAWLTSFRERAGASMVAVKKATEGKSPNVVNLVR